jgi:predicted RNA polymerase sigma factor
MSGDVEAARGAYEQAAALATSLPQRRYLTKKLAGLTAQ